jgi:hypothetical protein
LQFVHDAALTLKAYNAFTDAQIGSQAMDSLGNNYYELEFIPNVFISSDTIKGIYFKVFNGATDLAKTDCVVIGGEVDYGLYTKNYDLDCSVTISYTNATNFDGILYEQSPQPEFQITIPCQFDVEDNPQEQEDSELSNGVIVTIRQSIQQKRLLKTGYMPNDMHLKLQKILMHDTITINGTEWKKRDAYESEPVNRYGLKTASVLLTKYNSVQKNTL